MLPVIYTRKIVIGGCWGTIKGTNIHQYAAEGNLEELKKLLGGLHGTEKSSELMRWLPNFPKPKLIDSFATYKVGNFLKRCSALELALRYGHYDVATYLLNNGAAFREVRYTANCFFNPRHCSLRSIFKHLNLPPIYTAYVCGPIDILHSFGANKLSPVLRTIYEARPDAPTNFKLNFETRNGHENFTLPIVFLGIACELLDHLDYFANELKLDMNGRGFYKYSTAKSKQFGDNQGITAVEFMLVNGCSHRFILEYMKRFITQENISEKEVALLLQIGDAAISEYLVDEGLCKHSSLSLAVDGLLRFKDSASNIVRFLEKYQIRLSSQQMMHAIEHLNCDIGDYLLKYQMDEVERCAPYLVRNLAKQSNMISLNFLIQNLVGFNYSKLKFDWAPFVSDCRVADMINVVHGLFKNQSAHCSNYQANLNKAFKLGLFTQPNSPLINVLSQSLRDLGYHDQQILPILSGSPLSPLQDLAAQSNDAFTVAYDTTVEQFGSFKLAGTGNENYQGRSATPGIR